jgi:dihydropteroate synthase
VLGPSRKSFIAAVDGSAPEDRLGGTIAACLLAADRGVSVLRVHDVAAVRQALDVARAAALPLTGTGRSARPVVEEAPDA